MSQNDDFDAQLGAWAEALLNKLSTSERRILNRQIAKELRQSQQRRIKAQQNPDGSSFTTRKRQLRTNKGRIRANQKMYKKLIQARHLKAKRDARSASVEFKGRAAWIAKVSQYGLRDKVNKRGLRIKYATRKLLGFSRKDRARIAETILEHLTKKNK